LPQEVREHAEGVARGSSAKPPRLVTPHTQSAPAALRPPYGGCAAGARLSEFVDLSVCCAPRMRALESSQVEVVSAPVHRRAGGHGGREDVLAGLDADRVPAPQW